MKPLISTLLAALLLTAVPAQQDPPPDAVFELTRVHLFHLHVAAAEWQRMQPKGGMPFFGLPKKPAEPPADPPADVHKSTGFGLEFPWVHADVTAAAETFKDVGLRYKGNGSYAMSMQGLKRNFKIDLAHYDGEARYHGRKSITLNAGAMDPTRLREALAYALFRAADFPAPRTAFAEVTLTVPGKYQREVLGLYTLVEPIDSRFLKRHFPSARGLLLKPEKLPGLNYLGDDWTKYVDRYRPKRDAKKAEQQRVIAFTRLINLADEATFRKEISGYLELDSFLRFVAVNALVANMDSFLSLGHNYFLHLDPQTKRFTFIPWDLDLAFAGFPFAGTPEQQADLSLMRPYFGQNKLVERLLAMPEMAAKYRQVVRKLTTTCFTTERLSAEIDALEQVTRAPLAREKQAAEARKEGKGGPGGPGMMFPKPPDLRGFIEKRGVSVAAQLDGKSQGYVPVMRFGGPPPGGFGPGKALAKPILLAFDTDKDGKVSLDELTVAVGRFFDDCDKDSAGKLDEAALAAGLARIWPLPPGAKAPAAFGPAKMLAGVFVKRADRDTDGKVSRAELVSAAAVLFREVDKERQGGLDEAGLATAINRLFPMPAFGPPAVPKQGEPKRPLPNTRPD